MSGTPTEAEIQSQWRAAVDVLETSRNLFDATLAGAGGKFDVLLQTLEGDYTPGDVSAFVASFRSSCSSLVSPSTASGVLTPIMLEYGRILAAATGTTGFGNAYRNPTELFRALYEWFVDNSLTVKTRAITYDTTATLGGTNVGNGEMSRLTVDENNFALEACHVERKMFRCRADQNSGTEKQAEVFEFVGQSASLDNLLRYNFGSGEGARVTITSKHAGTGSGGSLLTNSTFSEYSASGSPKFTAWTESAGGASVSQDTTNYYRSHPGSSTNASLKITGGAGTVTLKQPLTRMRVRRLDPNTPYFFRVMLNKTIGAANGGTVTIRCGSQSASIAISSLAAGWAELMITPGTASWSRNFHEDPFDIEIEWSSSTSGYLLVDDVIFCPWDLVDGTYWCLRGNAATHTPWLLDDMIVFTDTGGAPATGKIQWWLFVSGFGYLPSSGAPTFTDP